MKKPLFRLLLLPCLLAALPALRQHDAPARPDSVQTEIETEALTARLEAAYRQLFPNDTSDYSPRNCTDPEKFHSPLLDDFLEEWHRRYAPTEAADRQRSDTLAAIYDIFTDFCRLCMTDIKIRRNHTWETIGRYRYMIVPESCLYEVNDEPFDRHLIRPAKAPNRIPFRPDTPGSRSLRMTDVYTCAIERFLRNRDVPQEHRDSRPAVGDGEYRRRCDFIGYNIPLLESLEGGWYYKAEPLDLSILFNSALDQAFLRFGYGPSGVAMEAVYDKSNEKWTNDSIHFCPDIYLD